MHNPTPASDAWKKAPGKKNTRDWCKGKVGRPHTPETRMMRWPYRLRECGMSWDLYPWEQTNPILQYRRENHWVCFHEVFCTTCGKILHSVDSKDCPTKV